MLEWPICVACGAVILWRRRVYTCDRCANQMAELALINGPILLKHASKEFVIPSFFLGSYREDFLRKLILKVKVQRDVRAADWLTDQICKNPRLPDFLASIEQIVVAPSSFWSRTRGKIDLAYQVASRLSSQFDITLKKLGFFEYMNLKKTSFQSNAAKYQMIFSETSAKSRENQRKNNLFVDDLVTTGHTALRTMLASGQEIHSFKLLALAKAS